MNYPSFMRDCVTTERSIKKGIEHALKERFLDSHHWFWICHHISRRRSTLKLVTHAGDDTHVVSGIPAHYGDLYRCNARRRWPDLSGASSRLLFGNTCRINLDMAYHLSVVEILEEINQQDTPPSSNPHTPQMTITLRQFLLG